MSTAVVTGARPPKTPDRPRLTAASEKVILVPHWWHRVAFMPTSVPHEGHIFGRGSLFAPKMPRNEFFHLSVRLCH